MGRRSNDEAAQRQAAEQNKHYKVKAQNLERGAKEAEAAGDVKGMMANEMKQVDHRDQHGRFDDDRDRGR